ncbi:MAG TPA: HAD family hydrolase [Allosphingosinicella sp.]
MSRRITHLICDLDNTLYDWVSFFVPSFYAMVEKIVEIVGCDREVLLEDFRQVHMRNRDSEHGFAALETETLRSHFAGMSPAEIARHIDPALHAYNRMRKERLKTYPRVHETLTFLRSSGVRLVAHSEAKFHSIADRLSRLSLFEYFDTVYCRERSASSHPDPDKARTVASAPELAKIVELSHHQRKPSVDVLLEICGREKAAAEASAYVGDSIPKDIAMANQAGLFSVWARYGATLDPEAYEQLVRVSHWTAEEVEQEREFRRRSATVQPRAVLEHGFYEILDVLSLRREFDQDSAASFGS